MSTNNMSDEELDQLFRESAEGYEPPFNPAAWADMDQRLDTLQGGKGRGAWYYSALILLLFLGLLSVPTLFTSHQEKSAALVQSQSENEATAPEKATSVASRTRPEATTMTSLSTKKAQVSMDKAAIPENTQQKERFSPETQKTAQKRVAQQRRVLGIVTLLPGKKRTVPYKLAINRKESNAGAEKAPQGLEEESLKQQETLITEQEAISTKEKKLLEALTVLVVDSADLPKNLKETPVELVPSQDSLPQKQAPVTQESNFLRFVQVGVAIAPDITTVKFKGAGRISPNAGMLVAVPISKRWSLVTGAIWARKIYSAPPEEYTAPAGSAISNYKNDIDAVCQVIDLPLNLKYTLWQKGGNTLALQAGLSSYLMLSEKYTYSYTAAYGYGNPAKTYTKTWEVDNENRHWFQVQNLSVSYARTFASGLSLGVEPFVKIPLSGIGEGKVNLTSAGVFFSTSYTFHLKP
ncbi:outer membrane beta-barrel protein [Nibribacter ruber]|uniref:Outer membrane beta-barrel protein n=1 Tax=Nibribacter ruber TaxID=2698458 RepID=A0A6P1NYC0_9BACT|nr:outer membrane beta-barrel protein [Nibribacter ruber]QHL86948.1 outer membrane beta-barrel protein [Nibribacter ruber]